ncbi:MAG: hypothetical protein ACFHWZ_05155 [Phycisphaerales bacterium]
MRGGAYAAERMGGVDRQERVELRVTLDARERADTALDGRDVAGHLAFVRPERTEPAEQPAEAAGDQTQQHRPEVTHAERSAGDADRDADHAGEHRGQAEAHEQRRAPGERSHRVDREPRRGFARGFIRFVRVPRVHQ